VATLWIEHEQVAHSCRFLRLLFLS
jgi:hypothetical protein